jgi:glucose/arabinose dehydrogenase
MVGWTGDFLRRAGLAGAGVASGLASLARPAGARSAPGKPRPNILFTSPNGNHNAGDLHFGKDGYLYISALSAPLPDR